MTEKDPGFYTYDFKTSRRRDYPTFEMVPDVVALAEKEYTTAKRTTNSVKQTPRGRSRCWRWTKGNTRR